MKQRRTIASIDDHTDGNNRPNKRNRSIDRSADDDDDDKGDEEENSDNDDDGEWTVAYLLSRMKCGEATLPERLQIQSTTAFDPYLFVEISTHSTSRPSR